MIDYVKMAITTEGYKDQLYNNSLLEFITPINDKTGELTTQIYTAKYKGLEFIIFNSDRVEIKGSLHKYFNGGLHNHNDFSLFDLNNVISELKSNFNIDPNFATIHNLEIGINITTQFNPTSFIGQLNNYKRQLFDKMSIRGPGYGRTCRLTQYLIKVYNKGLQYNLDDKILRFEVRYSKIEAFKKEYLTLNDLTNPEVYLLCQSSLLAVFDKIIINENINTRLLSGTEKKIYEKYRHPDSWLNLNRKQNDYYKRVFNEIIEKHTNTHLKETVRNLLIEKGDYLLSNQREKGDNLTGINNNKIGQSDRLNPIITLGQSDHLDIRSNQLNPLYDQTRRCLTCNKDISGQSHHSIYCTDQRQCRDKASNRNKKRIRNEAIGLIWPYDEITLAAIRC